MRKHKSEVSFASLWLGCDKPNRAWVDHALDDWLEQRPRFIGVLLLILNSEL